MVNSGCKAAEDLRDALQDRLDEIFKRISAIAPKTVADLAILANAIKRWDAAYIWRRTEKDDEITHPEERLRDLVDCILGVATTGGADV